MMKKIVFDKRSNLRQKIDTLEGIIEIARAYALFYLEKDVFLYPRPPSFYLPSHLMVLQHWP